MTPRSPKKRLKKLITKNQENRKQKEADETIIDLCYLLVAQFDFQEHLQNTTGHFYNPDIPACIQLFQDLRGAVHYHQDIARTV